MTILLGTRGFVPWSLTNELLLVGVAAMAMVLAGWVLTLARSRSGTG
jgi:hypothetical protein